MFEDDSAESGPSPGGSFYGRERCLRGLRLKKLLIPGQSSQVSEGGWELTRRDPNQKGGVDKPGLLSTRANGSVELDVGGSSGTVFLGFLRSWDKAMGKVQTSCVRGCTCLPKELYGWHGGPFNRKTSIFDLARLSVSVNRSCVLRLTHLPRDSTQVASRFMLFAVIVPPFGLSRRSMDDLRKGIQWGRDSSDEE